ncbi:MAG: MgtC/SapB family protein [Gemmatimonadetes bacterium]|nr:MgtC/SapB family protein [Gemmatimonadota bacterium]
MDGLFLSAQGSLAEVIANVMRVDLGMKLLAAVLAGGAIGFERQVAGKPAGLRTNILICVGSALVMDLSIRIGSVWGSGPIGDPGRIAAQVITGLTSAATIWVVAAIGLSAGAGFYVEALGATLTVMVVLAGLGRLEHGLLRVRRSMNVTIRTKPGIPLEFIREQLNVDGLEIVTANQYDHPSDRVFELRVKGPARQFEIARSELVHLPEIKNVFFD